MYPFMLIFWAFEPESAGFTLQAYVEAAEIMLEDDIASNKAIGSYGAKFIQHHTEKQKLSVLTHCNTGRCLLNIEICFFVFSLV